MAESYIDLFRASKYKLMGNGPRSIRDLLEAFENLVSEKVVPDTYGNGKVINDFETEVAQLLGKEKGVFFPSGTMAQQIALRIWADRASNKKVAYHPLCHLEIHEKDGLKMLHYLEPILLGDKNRLFTLEDLKNIKEPVSCVLIELPQREIGGQLPSFEELVEISDYCREKGIKLHLDGARLFETLPYFNKTASEICDLFDSAYVSFYKGLGGVAGAMLVGELSFMEEAIDWKRRHGGDLISLYPYIVNAKHCLHKRLDKMGQYWSHAEKTAGFFNKMPGVSTSPEIPVCNMFHVYFSYSKEAVEKILGEIIERYDLGIIGNLREMADGRLMSELSFGDSFGTIPESVLEEAFKYFKQELEKI